MENQPAIVLVNPQMSENIGASARAMANFGLTELRLVAPREAWPNPKAIALASGADDILERAEVCEDVPSAIAEFDMVLATTARLRERPKPVFAPRHAAAEMRDRCSAGGRCAVLFGSERAGLDNDDMLRSEALIHIPAASEFLSLNLAQAVLVMAYEWRCATADHLLDVAIPDVLEQGAPQDARERLVGHLIESLESTGFFHPPERKEAMVAMIRNLFHRVPVSDSEVRMLRGVVHSLSHPRRS